MFDLINAPAEYQAQLKLFLKQTSSIEVDDTLRIYLEKSTELECYKVGRFINLDTNTAMYCEWLYQFYKMQMNYDKVLELFTVNNILNIDKQSNPIIREYHKDFYSYIWPKILISFAANLSHLKEEVLKKHPYSVSAIHSIDELVSDFQTHFVLSSYKNYSKPSFLQKGKYSLSYLKIGFPLYLGIRQDIIEGKIVKPDNINWTELNEFLQSMCLIHFLNNDEMIVNKIAFSDNTIQERYDSIMNNSEKQNDSKNQLVSSIYSKCQEDLKKQTLLEKHKIILENLLHWCHEFKDEKYKQK